MSDRAFNDRLDSTTGGKRRTRVAIHDGPIDGVRTALEPTRSYIGDLMNDRTSSLQWS
ncbi:hypothetical protein ACQEU6_43885 [Spirillospora sp. CA-108201]